MMVRLIVALLCLLSLFSYGERLHAQDPTKSILEQSETFASGKSEAGYSVGYSIAKELAPIAAFFDEEALMQGIRDGLHGHRAKYSDEQMQAGHEALARLKRQDDAASPKIVFVPQPKNVYSKSEIAAAKAKAEEYLQSSAKRPGTKVTESGLQYRILEAGTGPSPTKEDTVRVRYRSMLPDGKVIDGSTANFPVSEVIPGWTEALQLMKVGDKWSIDIPPHLAYGETGTVLRGVGPNQVLIFEVELLGIVEQFHNVSKWHALPYATRLLAVSSQDGDRTRTVDYPPWDFKSHASANFATWPGGGSACSRGRRRAMA